jgi:hypothetical protein
MKAKPGNVHILDDHRRIEGGEKHTQAASVVRPDPGQGPGSEKPKQPFVTEEDDHRSPTPPSTCRQGDRVRSVSPVSMRRRVRATRASHQRHGWHERGSKEEK